MAGEPAEFKRSVDAPYAHLTPGERIEIWASMCNAARASFESTLPPDLDEYERKRRITSHFYGQEFADRVFPIKASSEG